MKKQIFWLVVLLKKIRIILKLFIFINFLIISYAYAEERWVVDPDLSSITFEVPVLVAKDVSGNFSNVKGFVILDNTNKALFSVDINSINLNYKKYKKLLLSNNFFDEKNYSKTILEVKKFSYLKENDLIISADLTIKNITNSVPINIKYKYLTDDLVQINGNFILSRKDFNLGIGKWSNTSIMKDKIKIKAILFLFRE